MPDDLATTYAILCIAAFFAGAMNSIAGGGTLLTFPALTAALLFVVQAPISRWMKKHRPDHEPGPGMQVGLVFFQFLIAVYGGYFGAGIGILMITAFGFMGIGDIHRINAVKTFLAAMIN